jgi:hypothetical protein
VSRRERGHGVDQVGGAHVGGELGIRTPGGLAGKGLNT